MTKPHIWPIRVYFEDTDAGKIVYYANYLKFTERARTEMLRAQGADHNAMIKDDGLMFVVKSVNIEYLQSAYLDDTLEVHSSILKIGNASLILQQDVLRGGVTLATSQVVLVSVNSNGQPCRIPASIRSKIDVQ
jgi:acyl-CoA thioester hydrolase